MKLRIIKIIFLGAFAVLLVIGLLSFTPGHHTNVLDSLILLISAITYLLSYLVLRKQSREHMPSFLSDRVIKITYLLTFILFVIIAALSFYHYRQMLAVGTLMLCAATQIIGYRVFMKQNK